MQSEIKQVKQVSCVDALYTLLNTLLCTSNWKSTNICTFHCNLSNKTWRHTESLAIHVSVHFNECVLTLTSNDQTTVYYFKKSLLTGKGEEKYLLCRRFSVLYNDRCSSLLLQFACRQTDKLLPP